MRSFLPLSLVTIALFWGAVACVTTPETGRSAFILTSEAQENALGLQAYQEVLQKEQLSTNARWNALIQRVGQRIAQAANKPSFQWQFRLIESKEMNAFCLPGGKVAFYTGILPIAQNEAGVAAIMGHEVAHATARHGGQRITTGMSTQIAMMGLGAVLGSGKGSQTNQLLMAALGMGAQVGVMLPFSRANESEADQIGLVYMARAGYDPHEAPKIWARMAQQAKGSPPEFLSTHPASANRERALAQQVPSVLPVYNQSPKYGTGEAI